MDLGNVTDIVEHGPVHARRAGWPVAAAIAALVLAVFLTGYAGAPGRSAKGPASGQPVASAPATVRPDLVVPPVAHAGERLTVLAHRNHRLCGPAQLRFDGGAVPHRVIRDLGPVDANRTALVMTIDVPRSAGSGRHVIQLYGPKPGGRGPVCTDAREHQGEIDSAALVIG